MIIWCEAYVEDVSGYLSAWRITARATMSSRSAGRWCVGMYFWPTPWRHGARLFRQHAAGPGPRHVLRAACQAEIRLIIAMRNRRRTLSDDKKAIVPFWTFWHRLHTNYKNNKHKKQTINISPLRGGQLPEPIDMLFVVLSGVPDVITHAEFCVNRLRSFSTATPPKVPFPILVRTTFTTVLHYCADCDGMIYWLTHYVWHMH